MRTKPITLRVMLLLCILSVAGTVFALTRSPAEFVPPPFEADAAEGTPRLTEDGLRYGLLDTGAYTVGLCGMPTLNENRATLYFTNPETNTVWLKLRVCAPDGAVLGESGLLRPGQYVREIILDRVPEDPEVTFKVMGYEPDTYRSAGAVNLRIQFTIIR